MTVARQKARSQCCHVGPVWTRRMCSGKLRSPAHGAHAERLGAEEAMRRTWTIIGVADVARVWLVSPDTPCRGLLRLCRLLTGASTHPRGRSRTSPAKPVSAGCLASNARTMSLHDTRNNGVALSLNRHLALQRRKMRLPNCIGDWRERVTLGDHSGLRPGEIGLECRHVLDGRAKRLCQRLTSANRSSRFLNTQ